MDAKAVAVVEWARTASVKPGTVAEFPLPADLAAESADGKATVAGFPGGERCVLLKKEIGWKGNFAGVVFATRPLGGGDVVPDPGGRPYLSLAGYGIFEELYIKATRSPRHFEVYFDLY